MSMIKQLQKSKEEAIEKYISKFKIVLHAEEMQKIQFWSGTIEEQQLALIQEIKDWAEKKKWKIPNYSLEEAYEGGKADDVEYVASVEAHNKILEDLLKELDNIKK